MRKKNYILTLTVFSLLLALIIVIIIGFTGIDISIGNYNSKIEPIINRIK